MYKSQLTQFWIDPSLIKQPLSDKAKIFTKPQHIYTKHVKLHLNTNKLITYIVVKRTLFLVTINK